EAEGHRGGGGGDRGGGAEEGKAPAARRLAAGDPALVERGGAVESDRTGPVEGVEVPLPGDALQRPGAAIDAHHLRAGDELADGAGDEDLPGAGLGGDAGAEVDGDTADLAVHELDLAGVETGADLEALPMQLVGEAAGAADGGGGAVEDGEEAVSGTIHLAATGAAHRLLDDAVIAGEQLPP